MVAYKASLVDGQPVFVPNYEPPTLVTMTNNWTTNATTIAKRSIMFNLAEYDINVSLSGANTQGVLQLNLPSGDVIDDSVLAVPANLSQNSIPCNVTVADASGISRYRGRVFINTTTNVRVYIDELTPASLGTPAHGYSNTIDSAANRPITLASGDFVSIRFSVPLTRLAGGMTVYGAGRATPTRDGLVTPRKGQFAMTVTGTNWTSVRSVGIYYQDQDGNHRLKMNVFGTTTAVARTQLNLAITGIVFKTGTRQKIPCDFETTTSYFSTPGFADGGTNLISFNHASQTSVNYYFSADLEIDSKPSWA